MDTDKEGDGETDRHRDMGVGTDGHGNGGTDGRRDTKMKPRR